MAKIMNFANKIGKLVSDAIPDPPRCPDESFSGEKDINKNVSSEPKINAPPVNAEHYSPNSSSNTSSKVTTSKAPKDFKPKRKSKPSTTNTTTINYNFNNSEKITIGPTTKYVLNYNNFQDGKCEPRNKDEEKNEPTEMLPCVKDLTSCSLEITKEDMILIKTHIGNGWKKVAKHLGYSKGQIEQFSENYKQKSISEIMYQILLDWKQSQTKNASVGCIICALWSSKEYECAEKLAIFHSKS